MKISYDFDIDDWNSFQRYHYSVSATYRRMRTITRLLLPVAFGFFLASQIMSHGFELWSFSFFVIISVVWFVFYPLWFDRRVIRQGNRFLREDKTDNLFGRREIEFFPDRIQVISSVGNATYNASGIIKVIESPQALFLYISSIQALVIPKCKLPEDDFQNAVNFVKQHYVKR
ncbi:MAG: YcxB family protein [Chthoniobacterales bacterium]